MDIDRDSEVVTSSVTEVFGTMLGSSLTAGTPFEDADPVWRSEVMGLIGLAGDFTGCVSMHCTAVQAREFTARLIGMEASEVTADEDVRDAVGEIVNMIAGSVKTVLAQEGTCEIALPTVAINEKPDFHLSVKSKTGTVVPFEDPSGTFHVEIVVEDSRD